MKKLLLSGLLASGLALGAYAQGLIALDNNANTSTSTTATANGLFFLQTGAGAPVAINQDFNVAFYGGSDSTSLTLIKAFVGATAAGGTALGPGTFTDPTGATYPIAGTAPGGSAFFQIEAWTGSAADYATAFASGAPTGKSAVFSQAGLGGGNITPTDFTSMPAIVVTAVPEPSTFALAGLGAAAMLIFRKRK